MREIESSATETEVLHALQQAGPEVRAHVAGAAIERLSQPDVASATEHALQKFAQLLEPNPRAIKRFVNAYGMARACGVLAGSVVSRDALALWTILRLRWPGLAAYLGANPGAIEMIAGGDGAGHDIPDELGALFSDLEVARVATFPHGGPLGAEHVRLCCGGAELPTASPA